MDERVRTREPSPHNGGHTRFSPFPDLPVRGRSLQGAVITATQPSPRGKNARVMEGRNGAYYLDFFSPI